MPFDENLEILQVPPDSPPFFFLAPLIFAKRTTYNTQHIIDFKNSDYSVQLPCTHYVIFTFSAPVRQAGLAGMTRGSRTFLLSRTADRHQVPKVS
jgi:hypothetical protein